MSTVEHDPVYQATEVLFQARHQLPNDVLRSLACIWFCASAARFGQPYERFWEDDDYTEHDTVECELENMRREDDHGQIQQ